MLTYSTTPKLQRKDRPWLLFVMALIWVGGTTFFHDPWEPYEPYVVAIVKSIISTNNWLVPYLAAQHPYLELQPFYFWFFALIIKILNFSNIQNAVRLINSVLVFLVIALMGRLGSRLPAYKNGRSVVMILISSIGFINNAYQLSPNIVGILGLVLFLNALDGALLRPGFSGWLLSISLILISINFNAEYICVALILLLVLPILHRDWRYNNYLITMVIGCAFFMLFFASYAWQLHKIDHSFFWEWEKRYTNFLSFNPRQWLSNLSFYLQMLVWYLIPGWFLLGWTIYKRRLRLVEERMLQLISSLSLLLLLVALLSNHQAESAIFPLFIPVVLLAAIEIDSIRISIVSLFNWFSIFTFGAAGIGVITLYLALNSGHPEDLLSKAQFYAPNYQFEFNFWQLFLALIISGIWLFMVTRKHIRGREMVTNWASGSTLVLVMFISLCLPWFNAVLSFQSLVENSKPLLLRSPAACVATNGANHLQNALWYYYADLRLVEEVDFSHSNCQQALLALDNETQPDYPGWHIIWSGKRPIDTRRYILLERITSVK